MDESGDFVTGTGHSRRNSAKAAAPSNSGNSRTRKAAFTPMHVEAFWVPNKLADAAATSAAVRRPHRPAATEGRRGLAHARERQVRDANATRRAREYALPDTTGQRRAKPSKS